MKLMLMPNFQETCPRIVLSGAIALSLLGWPGPGLASQPPLTPAQKERILVLGAMVGETVHALGSGDQVVGRDLSCQHPADLAEKPDVGYHRALSAEGVLSLNPSAILGTTEAGPPNVVEQLQSSGLPVILLEVEHNVDSLKSNLRTVGDVLGASDQAEKLVAQVDADLKQIPTPGKKRRVLFLLSSPGSGRYMAAGTGTAADAMIRLAHAENIFRDMNGYKPVSAEVMADRRPDVVLVAAGGQHGETISPERIAEALPFLEESPAARSGRLATIDLAEFLTFGPRTGKAARELHAIIYQ